MSRPDWSQDIPLAALDETNKEIARLKEQLQSERDRAAHYAGRVEHRRTELRRLRDVRNELMDNLNHWRTSYRAVSDQLSEARKVIEPFVAAFLTLNERYVKAQSKWFEQMPERWPQDLRVTVSDCRAAREFLEKLKGQP